ncbi:MAG: LCP family protein [Clostridiales bacterium]|nr:LCP family protein [Clostridiales bacterium]
MLPISLALAILTLFTLLIDAAFMLMLTTLDVLPGEFVAIILILLAAVTITIIKLLNCRKHVTKQRKVGVAIATLLIVGLAVGSYYLYSTYSMFNKISKEDKQTEDFHVVVIKGGSYDKLKDIKGKIVFVNTAESKTYKEAKGRLMNKADITYETVEDYLSLGHKLVDDKGKKQNEIIFLNNSSYEMLCEDIDKFQKKTKIIYTISIDVEANDIAKRVNITEDPFNVYISGIDTFGSISKVSRSDVNMIMTVNPKTKQILLTSIPRDMYVELHSYGAMDKLTHSGIYGIEETVTTVEDWLDIDLNYYVRVNFTTLVDIVDVIGGVDVESEYTFNSSVSEYSYIKGMNHLDGEGALFFARERKSLEGGDNERIKNQQRVLKGIINKVTTSPVILTKYTQLLDAVGDKMQTNMSEKDISALVKMQLADLGGWDINTATIKGNGTYAATYSMGSRELYVAIPDEASVHDAQKQINRIIYPK